MYLFDILCDFYSSHGIMTETLEDGTLVFYRSIFLGECGNIGYQYVVNIVDDIHIDEEDDEECLFFLDTVSLSSDSDLVNIDHQDVVDFSYTDASYVSISSNNPNLDCVPLDVLVYASSEDYINEFGRYSSFIKVYDSKEVCEYLEALFSSFDKDSILIKLYETHDSNYYNLVIEGQAIELLEILEKLEIDAQKLSSPTFNFSWIMSKKNVSDFAFSNYKKTVQTFNQSMLKKPYNLFHIEAVIH